MERMIFGLRVRIPIRFLSSGEGDFGTELKSLNLNRRRNRKQIPDINFGFNFNDNLLRIQDNQSRFGSDFPYQLKKELICETISLLKGMGKVGSGLLSWAVTLGYPDHRSERLLQKTGQALAHELGADILFLDPSRGSQILKMVEYEDDPFAEEPEEETLGPLFMKSMIRAGKKPKQRSSLLSLLSVAVQTMRAHNPQVPKVIHLSSGFAPLVQYEALQLSKYLNTLNRNGEPPLFLFISEPFHRIETTSQQTPQLLAAHAPASLQLFVQAKRVSEQLGFVGPDLEAGMDWLVDRDLGGLRVFLLPGDQSNESRLRLDHQTSIQNHNYTRLQSALQPLGFNLTAGPSDLASLKSPLTRHEVTWLILELLAHSDSPIDSETLQQVCASYQANRNTHTTFYSSGDDKRLDIQALSKHEKRLLPCIVLPEAVKVGFNDIGALEGPKRTLRELISLPLERPDLFTSGVLHNSVTGILLFGPPGTGKTMLAKAVAAQSGAAFLSVSSASIFDMYVGEGEKNARALFTLARKLAPCVVFVDEVDALLDSRSNSVGRASRVEVLNEFMSEWDGIASATNQRVLVMAATNRPFALDDAVLRRLPRRLMIDLPDESARLKILKIILKDDKLAEDVDLAALATQTSLYSGSDLKNMAIAAGFRALRESSVHDNRLVLRWSHFMGALEDVPASISDRMDTVTELRRWDQLYGEGRKKAPSLLGFCT